MRVTFTIATADMSGGCKVVAIYARELIARGHDVLIVVPPRPQMLMRRRIRRALTGDFSHLFPEKPVSHLELIGVPHKYLERHRPIRSEDVPDADVIVATWWETAEWIRDFPRSKGARAYFVQGDEADLGNDRERVLRTWDLRSQKITISSWLAWLIRARTNETDIALVPNAIDRDQFDAPPRAKHARPTVGLCYSSMRLKGFDVAVRALERIRRAIPEVRVVCFSSEQPAAELPLPPGVEFEHRPAQDRIRDIYAACDVWLSASRAEGFGMPALEAMACRCPLVSTRYGGPADFVHDGDNGFLVESEDDEGLARRVLELLTASDETWQKMSNAAYVTAHSSTWRDAAVGFEAALRQAISRPSDS